MRCTENIYGCFILGIISLCVFSLFHLRSAKIANRVIRVAGRLLAASQATPVKPADHRLQKNTYMQWFYKFFWCTPIFGVTS